jgi:uncharacterized protein (TIGR02217 family)
MADAVFPTLPGLGWSVIKKPSFATRTQKSVSGRELRLADQLWPIWEWTLTYEILRDRFDIRGGVGLGDGFDELRTLAGFFLARRGSYEPFLFKDPTDYVVLGQYLGTGDGVLAAYQLYRSFGEFTEPVTAPGLVTIYDNGAAMTSGYTVNFTNGIVTFATPPASGHLLTVDIAYYFRVRFSDDAVEYENFVYQLWAAKEVKFRSVLA